MRKLQDHQFLRLTWLNEPEVSHLVVLERHLNEQGHPVLPGRRLVELVERTYPGHRIYGWTIEDDKVSYLLDRKNRRIGRLTKIGHEDLSDEEVLAFMKDEV